MSETFLLDSSIASPISLVDSLFFKSSAVVALVVSSSTVTAFLVDSLISSSVSPFMVEAFESPNIDSTLENFDDKNDAVLELKAF